MSAKEEFLSRWSRRKCEAKWPDQAEVAPAEPVEAPVPLASDGSAAESANPEVDLSSLPSIDSIDAATDITAFLRKGVPNELTHAALRRAWAADPAIRDFVGLAENAWDFNDPNAMPGFGPLDWSPAARSGPVDQMVEGVRQAVASPSDTPAGTEDIEQTASRANSLGQETTPMQMTTAPCASGESVTSDLQPVPAASQPVTADIAKPEETSIRRRTHGGALPR